MLEQLKAVKKKWTLLLRKQKQLEK